MGWLVDRLTPYKQAQPRWHDLALALEAYWDTYQTPAVERIEQMRSVFTANNEDVEMLLREAGVQFEVAIPVVRDNLAFAYSWRAYEIHRKDRHETIEQILRRDYSGTYVRWESLYAPKSQPYGHAFLTEGELETHGLTLDDVHRTYRGKVIANLTGLNAQGVRKEEFRASVSRKIEVLRPAHIVYDGEMFFQVFRAEFEPIVAVNAARRSKSHTHLFLSLDPSRYDEVPADAKCLDYQPIGTLRSLAGATHHVEVWPAGLPWRLDMGSTIDGHYWPLPGVEGSRTKRTGTLGSKTGKASPMGTFTSRVIFKTDDALLMGAVSHREVVLSASAEAQASNAKRAAHSVEAWPTGLPWRLDMGSMTDGHYQALPGVEGDQTKRVGTLSGKAGKSSLLGNFTSQVTFRAGNTLLSDTIGNRKVAFSVRAEAQANNAKARQCAPAKTVRQPAIGPRFDDVPADFSPLDMNYEVVTDG